MSGPSGLLSLVSFYSFHVLTPFATTATITLACCLCSGFVVLTTSDFPKAQYALGYFTEMGIGCRRDPLEANVWYVRAADQGDERAVARLAIIRNAETGDSLLAAASSQQPQLKKKKSWWKRS